MSGDVQPRKRKDKKRKKDDLGIEEPRGTAAVLGEGDIFMHSYHDHGTGGHWCAKIIFFSLLAVLVTLIGLIILENRGLSELEANAVKSQYSGVFEGWLEDAPDDDHHDEHTLELKHHDHDEDEDDHGSHHDDDELNHEDLDQDHDADEQEDDEHDLESAEEEGGVKSFFGRYFGNTNEDEKNDENYNEDETEESADEDLDDNEVLYEEDQDDETYEQDEETYSENEENGDDNDQNDEEDNERNDEEYNEHSVEEDEIQKYDETVEENDEDNLSDENHEEYYRTEEEIEVTKERFDDEEEDVQKNYEDDEEHEEDEEEDEDIAVERIEREVTEEEPISLELGVLQENDDNENDMGDLEKDDGNIEKSIEDELDEDEEFFEEDEEPLPVVERITAPVGKPLPEVEDDVSSEKPPDTLEEEEEYEKQQEERKREEAQASHIWLKLGVGGALLVATHAVIRRATAPRDEPESDEHETREETPTIDRRMTLIAEQPPTHVPQTIPEFISPSTGVEERIRQIPSITKSAPTPTPTSFEDEEPEEIQEVEPEEEKEDEKEDDKELYSEEEVEEEEEEIVSTPIVKEAPKQAAPVKPPRPSKAPILTPTKPPTPTPTKPPTPTPTKPPTPPPQTEQKQEEDEEDDEVGDDVEIIEDDIEEEEEDDEEEISDVDDTELLTRLEVKYGRVPEPERPGGYKPKDGGNSIEDDEWPGEPVESYWRQQLDALEEELRQGEWSRVAEKASAPQLSGSARARFLVATALDRAAEHKRDNTLLSRSITAYLNLLKMNEQLSDKKLVQIANRTIDRIQFRGNYLNAEPVYRLLIRRFPDDISYRNKLSISFLMANRGDLAEQVLKETLARWPDDPVALAHYAFVLKTQHNKLEEAVELFQKALEGDKGPACEPRFYYHLGDALLLLGRFAEAHEVHKRGAKHGHFLSPAQRSLYNVPRLKSQPWWNVQKTPYASFARALERSWRDILKEGLAAKALYEKEKEGLKETGDWSQLDLFVRGMEIPGRCKRAPVTCSVVKSEVGAMGCRRGQVKFSAMEPGTHVRPHVGPTNCRLRMHLGLTNTKDTFIRVDQETRQWQEGKVLMFDDSFEHEVWHNGTGTRLVLIVDVWHPDLTAHERRTLTAI